MDYIGFMDKIEERSKKRINRLHHFAKKIWEKRKLEPIDVQNKCLESWDEMKYDIGCEIIPLIEVNEDHLTTNLIFGSGKFSTGKFQVKQYEKVKKNIDKPPIKLQGIVANKSTDNGCNAKKVSKKYNLPFVELDFIDWYHNHIDKNEKNPIKASRYWYDKKNSNESSLSLSEISRRFKIRQIEFHKNLGELIYKTIKNQTDIVSARGYNFQFCSKIFQHQINNLPHINDTHPADLTYIDPKTNAKLYAGWQTKAVQKMIDNKIHETYHGSLIGVEYMDSIQQINTMDEGALLAKSHGVSTKEISNITAKQIQDAMKIMDDNFFCSLEPTGLILSFGITKKPVPVIFQTKEGKKIIIKQKAVVVGNKFRSGLNVWGANLEEDIKELDKFLFP